ncbi:MAG: TatD family hydrolase [Rikenellaceae bacterium]|nr:TatD family hydrolase [Rikenellaceae bacterium]
MQLIDTHSHLYDEAFDEDRAEALLRAANEGVEKLLLPAIDSESHEALFALARRDRSRLIPMMGLHPTSINDNPHWREELALVEKYLATPPEGIAPFCAVGEIGLDFYWSSDFKDEQTEAFIYQLRLAAERDLPVAIHTRAAWEAMSEVIGSEWQRAREAGKRLRGVFHAFSEDAATYRRLKELTHGDFCFGIGGVVTYKKSVVATAVPEMELRDILLETDCPYLTPVPHRGKRNESSYVSHTCRKVAELKGVDPATVATQTTENSQRLFNLNA